MKIPQPFNYEVLTAQSPEKLTNLVIDAMDRGYTPFGGIARSEDGDYSLFAQAVAMFSSDGEEDSLMEDAVFKIEQHLARLVTALCPPSDGQSAE
jgi:hypothetical protein